ncbi:MAG TPA: potassium-transporting ATPase subunit C, partial [Solirubrobacteraceae bacterium]|nr:potassium-transporting ATPase subunit C [Solirubrobacteraceae bacterium]
TASHAGRASISQLGKGPQGFSETFYAYLSQSNNNGSAFAGYTGFIQPNAGNAGASAFSNHGPNSRLTEEADAENLKAYLELNRPYDPGLMKAGVPVDAVNTSGSDLDPEISEANARIQAHRVATLRHLSLARVNGLIANNTSGRGLGFSGEPGVNVLELNLALDRLNGGQG